MNETIKLIEDFEEYLHEGMKMLEKMKSKMGMRRGRMGRMEGYYERDHMGEAGGVYWGKDPRMNQMEDGYRGGY